MNKSVYIICTSLLLVLSTVLASQDQARKTLNFNHNWQFVRIDQTSTSLIDSKYLVGDKKDWRIIHASSQETTSERTPASNCIDGDTTTMWHTKYSSGIDGYPHSIVIDLKKASEIEGFVSLNRQDGRTHCNIKDYQFYVSDILEQFGEPIHVGQFKDNSKMQLVGFDKGKSGRYVKIVALSSYSDNKFAAIAELDLIKHVNTGSAWQDQYLVQHFEDTQTGTAKAMPLDRELEICAGRTWDDVTLPHTAIIEPKIVKVSWQGLCFYRKNFTVDKNEKGKKVFIEFEAAMQVADVWLNGKHMIQHAGGYTPFAIDISDVVQYGKNNTLTVKLDNRDNPQVPPGKPAANLDFCYYGGIYRDVRLVIKDRLHITNPNYADKIASGGVFVTYDSVTEDKAVMDIKTHLQNDHEKQANAWLRQNLIDASGMKVAETSCGLKSIDPAGDKIFKQKLIIDDPKLWSPSQPNLYTLHTEVLAGSTVVDEVRTQVGIRWFEISREKGFVLNGKPLKLRGTNRHQDYPWVGNALSNNASYRDMQKIRNAGFNIVRLGHYPQDPSVYQACNELGLLAIDPIPGWQFFNNSEIFINRTYRDIRDMIRRDRNHPCVLMWEIILNEAWPPNTWKDKAQRIAREEFPGPQCFTAGDMYGYHGWDILYNDWSESHQRPNDSDKPGFIREYGDYEFGGNESTTRKIRSDGEKALLGAAWNVQWGHNNHLSQYPWTMGDANWAMFDHNRGYATDISECGVSDITRLPKFGNWFFRSQRQLDDFHPAIDKASMVYIANYWDKRPSPCKVVVYSNCDEIQLVLNGEVIATKKPDNGPDSPYHPRNIRHTGGNPYDGGNCRNLSHPPFTFDDIEYIPGQLRAIGMVEGKVIADDVVYTPSKPEKIKLVFDTSGRDLVADGSDVIFIHAYLIDKNGQVNRLADDAVEFTVSGDAKIISPAKTQAQAGIATILIQAGSTAGKIRLTARSEQLKSATAKLEIKRQ